MPRLHPPGGLNPATSYVWKGTSVIAKYGPRTPPRLPGSTRRDELVGEVIATIRNNNHEKETS